ncbi:MAG: type II toxin-antitoxin system PemK/MazF family toxin, partial [Longicatena caecimuris]|uniref:type II toxin-antitoxin system PemK/MazF family toxin n=1 Tax=Longicatena caecimuris TaxID=1796635 RepID=UPI00399C3005
LSNDTGNRFRPTVIVAAITSRVRKKTKLPTHYYLEDVDGLPENSIILFEQVRTIDKSRLKEKVTQLDKQSMEKIVLPLFISMGAEKELKAERRISHV